jgi:hypothetical protein
MHTYDWNDFQSCLGVGYISPKGAIVRKMTIGYNFSARIFGITALQDLGKLRQRKPPGHPQS